ncbi:hypothetical protein TSUD_226880 [Trifolium subterraneum]|uniref:Uncharacterized protein n=1 Tax=Trifolium subterraneum TaxID=3900 RepID=A0A2Z6NI07_TRISU|nr:hypothetical protein TSUD_226880 [Trifolium subterraneum]
MQIVKTNVMQEFAKGTASSCLAGASMANVPAPLVQNTLLQNLCQIQLATLMIIAQSFVHLIATLEAVSRLSVTVDVMDRKQI